ncbi:protein kinase, partial [Lacticaseibacillus rhamnosus]
MLSQLDHPNLITIHDFGTLEGGAPYFVMDFVNGKPLAQEIRNLGSIPSGRALRMFRDISYGLAYAHEKGVVHR